MRKCTRGWPPLRSSAGGRGEWTGCALLVTSRQRRPDPAPPLRRAARNVPTDRQSTAVGVVTAASYAGTALAFGVSPALIGRLGWPAVFYLFGAMALLWLPLWWPIQVGRGRACARCCLHCRWHRCWAWAGRGERGQRPPLPETQTLAATNGHRCAARRALLRAAPQQEAPPRPGSRAAAAAAAAAGLEASSDSGEESQGLLSNDPRSSGPGGDDAGATAIAVGGAKPALAPRRPAGAAAPQQARAPGGRGAGGPAPSAAETLALLLRQREVLAICVCQYCQSYGMYGLLTWLPTFFSDYYKVEVSDLGGFTLLPYVVQVGWLGHATTKADATMACQGLLARR